VRERVRVAQASIAEFGGLPDGRQTLNRLLETWLTEVVRPNLRPKTIRSYETVVRVHLGPSLGQLRLDDLRPSDVQALLNRLSSSGRSPRTVAMVRDVLRQALNVARRWGLLTRNVAELVTVPRAMRRERRALAVDEARQFVTAISGDRDEALYLLALTTGLRQGEVLGLRWSDLDLEAERGSTRIVQALSRVHGARLVDPKSAKGRRTVPLGRSIVLALRGHRARQATDRLLAGTRWIETGLVFTTRIGTPRDGPTVTRRLHAILESAELPQITFHDLRHSYASLMLAQGVPARVVMETLGHTDIRLTMNVYAHVPSELQRVATDRLDEALRAVP
jgi:integrase